MAALRKAGHKQHLVILTDRPKMSKLEPKALASAKEKLQVAKSKLEAMKGAKTVDELAQSWSEFLTEQHRVFLRLKKATERSAGNGGFDQIIQEQRTDQLLKYLLHARDAAEHGIEQITEKKYGGVAIQLKAPPGSNSVFVNNLQITTGPAGAEIKADQETLDKLRVHFTPASVHLVRVTDRGTGYDPPTHHLGVALSKSNPVSVAELAISYLETKLDEAETRYGH